MKSKILILIVILSGFIFSGNVNAENSFFAPKKLFENLSRSKEQRRMEQEDFDTLHTTINAIVLKKINPIPSYFYGKVEPIKELDLSFDFPGKIADVKPVGSYIVSKIEKDGKVVRNGTVVAEYDQNDLKYKLEQAAIAKKMAEEDIKLLGVDLEMTTKLIKSNAISKKQHNISQSKYNKAVLALQATDLDYERALARFNNSKLTSYFSGIVAETYVIPGDYVYEDRPIVKIQKMNPIVVKLSILPSLKTMIDRSSFFLVYPEGSDKPVLGWVQANMENSSEIYIYVNNQLELDDSFVLQPDLKSVYQVFPVKRIYNENPEVMLKSNTKQTDNIPLAVPAEAIKKDDKGYYVFIVENRHSQKATIFNLGNYFKVDKIYIKPGEIYRKYLMTKNTAMELRSLDDPGKLKPDDIVVVKNSEGLKSGERVKLVQKRWKFFPGQKVKIQIPALSSPGFFVPPECIISVDEHDNYIYVLTDDRKVKLEKVRITGFSKGYYSIINNTLKENDEVVIVDSPSLYKKLYDGAEVFVRKKFDPSNYLKRRSVERKRELDTNEQNLPSQQYKQSINFLQQESII